MDKIVCRMQIREATRPLSPPTLNGLAIRKELFLRLPPRNKNVFCIYYIILYILDSLFGINYNIYIYIYPLVHCSHSFSHISRIIFADFYANSYSLSKKFWLILFHNLLYKRVQDFRTVKALDILFIIQNIIVIFWHIFVYHFYL